MRVLHISTNDDGGAGIAALRLHKVMLEFGIDSSFLCLNKTTDVNNVFVHPKFYPRFYHRILSKIGIRLTQVEKQFSFQKTAKKYFNAEIFSLPGSDYKLHKSELVRNCDVVILHYVSGFLDYSTFFKRIDRKKLILWYSHDFNPVLGGFHTLFDAERNKESHYYHIENRLKEKKRNYLKQNKVYFIANSSFSNDKLKYLGITPMSIFTIPLGIPRLEFDKKDKQVCKKALGVKDDYLTLIVVSASFNLAWKGFDRLEEILNMLSDDGFYCSLITLGNNNIIKYNSKNQIIDLGSVWNPIFKSLAFSAADIVVTTSYEETFGQTIIEGYACGTAAISFDDAALPEIIIDGFSGYIVKSIQEYVERLESLYKDKSLVIKMGDNAFSLFQKNYTTEIHVNKFMKFLEKHDLTNE